MVVLLLHQQQQPANVKESKAVLKTNKNKNLFAEKYGNYGQRNSSAIYGFIENSQSNTIGTPGTGGTGLLLCCVCQEQNTTYRYEVVYNSKIDDKTLSFNATRLSRDEDTSFLPVLSDDSGIHSSSNHNNDEDEDDHEYYNFPPRHPRHGHLKWKPVYMPIFAFASKETKEFVKTTNSSIKTYPDYPVHLQTTTLRRAAAVIKSGKLQLQERALMFYFDQKSY